jgi:hypothetical protein
MESQFLPNIGIRKQAESPKDLPTQFGKIEELENILTVKL